MSQSRGQFSTPARKVGPLQEMEIRLGVRITNVTRLVLSTEDEKVTFSSSSVFRDPNLRRLILCPDKLFSIFQVMHCAPKFVFLCSSQWPELVSLPDRGNRTSEYALEYECVQ